MRPRYLTGVTLLMLVVPASAAAATLPGAPSCPVFPADNPWNQR